MLEDILQFLQANIWDDEMHLYKYKIYYMSKLIGEVADLEVKLILKSQELSITRHL